METKPLKLDFGCGPSCKEGFVGVDIREFPGVGYVCDAWEIADKVEEGTVAEIHSRHFLEHLTYPQAEKTLRAWKRVLRPNGLVQVIVPDILYHIGQFLSEAPNAPSEALPEATVLQHAMAGFWGWQREGEDKIWDVHKAGYDFRILSAALERNGFRLIKRLPDSPWNLNVTCVG